MTSIYKKFKEAEGSLQARVDLLGYTVKIEPIAALDMFYSDGLVGSCHGKAIVQKKDLSKEYQIFFPYYCLNIAVPEDLEREFKKWIEETS